MHHSWSGIRISRRYCYRNPRLIPLRLRNLEYSRCEVTGRVHPCVWSHCRCELWMGAMFGQGSKFHNVRDDCSNIVFVRTLYKLGDLGSASHVSVLLDSKSNSPSTSA